MAGKVAAVWLFPVWLSQVHQQESQSVYLYPQPVGSARDSVVQVVQLSSWVVGLGSHRISRCLGDRKPIYVLCVHFCLSLLYFLLAAQFIHEYGCTSQKPHSIRVRVMFIV